MIVRARARAARLPIARGGDATLGEGERYLNRTARDERNVTLRIRSVIGESQRAFARAIRSTFPPRRDATTRVVENRNLATHPRHGGYLEKAISEKVRRDPVARAPNATCPRQTDISGTEGLFFESRLYTESSNISVRNEIESLEFSYIFLHCYAR